MSIKCENEKDLSVCLHYQLINEIASNMWQVALIDHSMKEKHHSLIEVLKNLEF
jgi:hypothetical protein